jgi:hypothetical protein
MIMDILGRARSSRRSYTNCRRERATTATTIISMSFPRRGMRWEEAFLLAVSEVRERKKERNVMCLSDE